MRLTRARAMLKIDLVVLDKLAKISMWWCAAFITELPHFAKSTNKPAYNSPYVVF
jgi:hypothetical protein